MKKKLISIILCLVLALSILPVSGLAVQTDKYVPNHINHPACPHSFFSVSTEDFQMQVLEFMVYAANAKIEMYVMHAQMTPCNDVDRLLRQVDRTVAPVFAYADMIGATVVCEYVEYTVDGQTVLIDPIRVVRT